MARKAETQTASAPWPFPTRASQAAASAPAPAPIPEPVKVPKHGPLYAVHESLVTLFEAYALAPNGGYVRVFSNTNIQDLTKTAAYRLATGEDNDYPSFMGLFPSTEEENTAMSEGDIWNSLAETAIAEGRVNLFWVLPDGTTHPFGYLVARKIPFPLLERI